MTVEEAIEQLSSLQAELRRRLPELLAVAATDAKSLVQLRIQKEGIDANGAKLRPYDDKYAEQRQARGAQIGHVDLTVTGQMWGGTGIVSTGELGKDIFYATVAGRDQFTRDKLSGNSDKRGDVLRVSRDEELAVAESFENEIVKIVNQYFQ